MSCLSISGSSFRVMPLQALNVNAPRSLATATPAAQQAETVRSDALAWDAADLLKQGKAAFSRAAHAAGADLQSCASAATPPPATLIFPGWAGCHRGRVKM